MKLNVSSSMTVNGFFSSFSVVPCGVTVVTVSGVGSIRPCAGQSGRVGRVNPAPLKSQPLIMGNAPNLGEWFP